MIGANKGVSGKGQTSEAILLVELKLGVLSSSHHQSFLPRQGYHAEDPLKSNGSLFWESVGRPVRNLSKSRSLLRKTGKGIIGILRRPNLS